jgi:hypothetical protein
MEWHIPDVVFVCFCWRYSPLWALASRTIPLHFSLCITNSLYLLTPSTWRSLSTSSLHSFLVLHLRLVPSSYLVTIFLGILCSSILPRWLSQLILCPFIHFIIFSPLLNSSSSRFFLLFPEVLIQLILLTMGTWLSETVENRNKHIWKRIVRQVGYLQKLCRDARLTEHKILIWYC